MVMDDDDCHLYYLRRYDMTTSFYTNIGISFVTNRDFRGRIGEIDSRGILYTPRTELFFFLKIRNNSENVSCVSKIDNETILHYST